MITKTQLAYAAGYIDGDGCFHIRKRARKFASYIIISSVNKEVLEHFQNIFGGTIRIVKRTKQPEGHKPCYHYTLNREKGIAFSKNILPFLVEKKEEANLFIEFSNLRSKKREIILEKMKILKNFTNLATKDCKEIFEKEKNTIIPTEEDFSYLAGFIDAECCFGIQKYRRNNTQNFLYKILLQCNNTKTPVFKWLLHRFGGHINFINRSSTNKNERNQLCWRLSSKALTKILSKIIPYLMHKKPICQKLIEFSKTILPNGGARHTDIFRNYYQQILLKREEIVKEVHKLNQKGI